MSKLRMPKMIYYRERILKDLTVCSKKHYSKAKSAKFINEKYGYSMSAIYKFIQENAKHLYAEGGEAMPQTKDKRNSYENVKHDYFKIDINDYIKNSWNWCPKKVKM